MTARFENKILTPEQCLDRLSLATSAKPVVFTNGVFDILHRGHATYLDEAAQLGGVLVVGVNSDASARRLGKGPDRPLNNEHDRAALLAAMGCVNFVIVFDEDTPVELIRRLRPDIIVKGSMTVMVCYLPAARMGDMTAHGGSIVVGFPTVMIGG